MPSEKWKRPFSTTGAIGGLLALISFSKWFWGLIDAGGNVQFLAQSLSWLWKILDYRFLNTVVFIVGIGLFLYALMRKEKSDSSLVGSSPNEETGIGKLPTNSVGTDQSGLIIHSALWGAIGRYCDLRSKLQAKVQDDTLDAVVRFPDDQTMPKHAHL